MFTKIPKKVCTTHEPLEPNLIRTSLLFRCEAWNEAADNLRPALARLFVQYAPSVTVTPVRPGMIQEGDKVISKFDCKVYG